MGRFTAAPPGSARGRAPAPNASVHPSRRSLRRCSRLLRSVSSVTPPLASSSARPATCATAARSSATSMLSSSSRGAPAASASSISARVAHLDLERRQPGRRARAHARPPRDPAGDGDVVLLDQHRVVEPEAVVVRRRRPRPPPSPARAAPASSCACPAPARRSPRSARAARAAIVATPERCARKFSAVRSPPSSARARRRRPTSTAAPCLAPLALGREPLDAGVGVEQREGQPRRLEPEDHAGLLLAISARSPRARRRTVACARHVPVADVLGERTRDERRELDVHRGAHRLQLTGDAQQQVRAHERVEVAVEHALHVAGLVARAQVLDERVGVQDVGADLRAEVDVLRLALLARDLRLALALLALERASRAASPSRSPCWRTASARSGTARRSRSGGG